MTEHLRPHPAAGHLAIEKSPWSEVVTEPVTERQVARARDRINKRQKADAEPPEILKQLFGPGLQVVGSEEHDWSDDDIREVLSEGMCSFEAGIVVEVGLMPSGIELDYASEGCKVYFHENRGHTIGELTFLSIDQIIAWE